ncbi:MAG: 50S ribosomal protein L15e [Candidatus Aenigmarchaeota archaeon]|nr:50S ribosomal protein L15e [Candidatus Aenigmarchaeota archaeon]
MIAVKSFYKFLSSIWRKSPSIKERVITWRKGPVITRVENPTKLHRARELGYNAKQGFVIVRVRIKKGGRRRKKIRKGRKPKTRGRVRFTTQKSLKRIGEEKVARKYPNMEVLNSYFVAEDGQYKYFEVILVDRSHPAIKKDKKMKWITKQRRRALRGKTSEGRKNRGIR